MTKSNQRSPYFRFLTDVFRNVIRNGRQAPVDVAQAVTGDFLRMLPVHDEIKMDRKEDLRGGDLVVRSVLREMIVPGKEVTDAYDHAARRMEVIREDTSRMTPREQDLVREITGTVLESFNGRLLPPMTTSGLIVPATSVTEGTSYWWGHRVGSWEDSWSPGSRSVTAILPGGEMPDNDWPSIQWESPADFNVVGITTHRSPSSREPEKEVKCPVCGSACVVVRAAGQSHSWFNIGGHKSCDTCGLYAESGEFLNYGKMLRVGVVENEDRRISKIDWMAMETMIHPDSVTIGERHYEEARRIWSEFPKLDSEFHVMYTVCKGAKQDKLPWLVFADWLEERNFDLSSAYVRFRMEEQERAEKIVEEMKRSVLELAGTPRMKTVVDHIDLLRQQAWDIGEPGLMYMSEMTSTGMASESDWPNEHGTGDEHDQGGTSTGGGGGGVQRGGEGADEVRQVRSGYDPGRADPDERREDDGGVLRDGGGTGDAAGGRDHTGVPERLADGAVAQGRQEGEGGGVPEEE